MTLTPVRSESSTISFSDRDVDSKPAFDVECLELVQRICDVRLLRGRSIFPRGVYVRETKTRSCSV